jgi:gliding motility-associated-like protein
VGAGPADGNGYYDYNWIQNLTNSDWENSPDAAGTFTNPDYDPPALFDTTYYKRIVTSGRCVSYSPAVTVTVLPLITGNITTRVDSVICEGSLFNLLGASAPGGGDLSYKYHWQTSTDLISGWVDVSGIFDQASYLPDTSDFSSIEQLYFRRVVYSGADSVCQSNSVPIELTRYNNITGNSIAADQTIGSDSIPEPLAGTMPAEGGGDYLYLWESSADASVFNAADPVNSGQNYSPAALTDTTFYRRIVLSGAISKVCKDTSNIVVVNVHKTISNNSIAFGSGAVEDTICLGSTPAVILGAAPAGGSALPDDYDYQWYYSTDNINWDPVATGGDTKDFQPPSLLITTYFRRDVSSPKVTPTSVSVSNIIKITVLPLISNSISGSNVICFGTQPAALETGILSGGDNIFRFVWQDSVDITGWQNIPGGTGEAYQPPALTLPVDYRRIVYSGSDDCCVDTSNVLSIGIYQLPTGILTAITDTVCEGTQVPLNIALTGAAPWKIIYDVNSENSPEIDVTTTSVTLNDDPRLPEGSENLTFTYNLESVIDNNGCIATSLSGTRKAVVYEVPVAFAGDDTEVCGPEYTLTATPSAGTGTWTYPVAVVASSVVNPYTLAVTIDSTFAGNNIIHKFYWEEDNWQCSSKDSVEITFDKRISSINAGPDTALFSFDFITWMVAEPAIVGEGKWSVISGTGYFDNETDPQTKVSDLSPGINTYLWRIENGICVREDDITVTVSSITVPEGFSPNNDLINDLFIINGLDLNNQQAELQIVNGAGSVVFSTTNSNNQEWTDWDGKNSKGIDLPEGTYYFLLKLSSNNAPGVVYKNSGFVILKRY